MLKYLCSEAPDEAMRFILDLQLQSQVHTSHQDYEIGPQAALCFLGFVLCTNLSIHSFVPQISSTYSQVTFWACFSTYTYRLTQTDRQTDTYTHTLPPLTITYAQGYNSFFLAILPRLKETPVSSEGLHS